MRPPKIPYLHVRETDGSLLSFAVEVTGNRCALLRLRAQIDRALEDEGYPLEEAIYRELGEEEFEVVVRRARSREEMLPPKARKAEVEREGWAQRASREKGPKEED